MSKMNLFEASMEAFEIFNLGLTHVLHFAKSGEDQRTRFKINMRGTIDRLEALLEKMEE